MCAQVQEVLQALVPTLLPLLIYVNKNISIPEI